MSTWVDHEVGSEYVGVDARFDPTLESKEKHVNLTTLTLVDPPNCCNTPRNKVFLFIFCRMD